MGRGRILWIVISLEVLLVWGVLLAGLIGLGHLVTGPLADSVGRVDDRLVVWFADHRSSTATRLAEIGSMPGETIVIIVLGGCVAAVAWAWTRSSRPALFIVVALVGQTLLYYFAADVVSRPRPSVKLLDSGLDPAHSFPSGHVCSSLTLFGGVAVLIWMYADRRWRSIAVLLLVVPPVVAVARLYQGVHHLSDVLASLVVISLWLLGMAVLVLLSVVDPHRAEPAVPRVEQPRPD